MFKTTLAKALLGVGALSVAGGATAFAAAPQAAPGAGSKQAAHETFRGHVTAVKDSQLTVERAARKAAPGAASAIDPGTMTFDLNDKTAVFHLGDRDHKLGVEALKVGQSVAVRYVTRRDKKVARAAVILPEVRAGLVTAKDATTFTIRTADGKTIIIAVNAKTEYLSGRRGKDAGAFGAVRIGQRVRVVGQPDPSNAFDASRVRSWDQAKKK